MSQKKIKNLLSDIKPRMVVAIVISLIVLVGIAQYIHTHSDFFKRGSAWNPEDPMDVDIDDSWFSLPFLNDIGGFFTRITKNPFDQGSPAIYGNIVVWEDGRSPSGHINPNIYIKDLSKPWLEEKPLSPNPGVYQVYPDIDGDIVVWEDTRNGGYYNDIYMYDLSTGAETAVTRENSRQINPAIYGDIVVWEDGRNNIDPIHPDNWDIYYADISDPDNIVPVQLTFTDKSVPHYREVSPDVWQDEELKYVIVFAQEVAPYPSNPNAKRYNIAMIRNLNQATQSFIFFDENSYQNDPCINSDKIAWSNLDKVNNPYDRDIMLVDIYDPFIYPRIILGNDGQSKSDPQISGDSIVWSSGHVYLYNLNEIPGGTPRKLTGPILGGGEPAIQGKRVVWTDSRHCKPPPPYDYSNTEIYMFTDLR